MWQPPHLPLQASVLAGHADGEWAANIERSSTTCTENSDEELPKQQMISQAFSASLSLSGTERLSKREDVVSDCGEERGKRYNDEGWGYLTGDVTQDEETGHDCSW
ncbi:unnamed protein product [Leuciscus chuanchicus]